MSSGSMQSNVGNRQVYNDGDQRPHDPVEEMHIRQQGEKQWRALDEVPYPPQQHRAQRREQKARIDAARNERSRTVNDPLEPAQRQGHKPSRGAQVDAELKNEDQQRLQEKGPYFGVFHDKRQVLRPEKMERMEAKAEGLSDPVPDEEQEEQLRQLAQKYDVNYIR
ncbi:hypothetical protein OBBRIDRAFT_826380 [Obba rivulosa]|uniref:Uncharacterized protein n=1 Tax=Obba rivulosa TaxID=1052685 RepID=A0A8E2AX41_9APHY|nr:hypothetical protein OBBRIDRAFT_826380 [Obba rivulosa]